MSAARQPSDRLTFWRNWYDASRQLPDDMRLAWLDAVLDYAFGDIEPSPAAADCEAGLKAAIGYQAVAMVRATIDISRKRREIGSKGGEARSKAQAKAKQSASKSEAKRKQKRSKAQANPNQEQVQEQEQEQEHNAIMLTATTARGGKTPTIEQFVAGGELAGVPADFARGFYADLVAVGWRDADGKPVGNWRRYLRTAFLAEQKKISAAREMSIADIPMAR